MNKRMIETMVGGFVLLGLLALLFLAVKTANLGKVGGGATYEITANFDNIGGLKVRAPVRAAGVTVGRVTNISLDPKYFRGVVTLDIQDRFRFPADSSAKILTAGLLGDQYVGISAGGDDKDLEPGATIVQTQSAVVLENLIGQFLSGKAEAGADSLDAAPVAAPSPAPAAATTPAVPPTPAASGASK